MSTSRNILNQPRVNKSISLIILFTFIFPILSWAFEPNTLKLNWQPIFYQNKTVEINSKLARITGQFKGNQQLLVVHIQDLHCNYEVQKNISKILASLAQRHKLQLITTEGTSGPIKVDKLSSFPLRNIRDEVSDYYMRQGKITGAEHYVATSDTMLKLVGVEEESLYQASKKKLASFYGEEGQGYIYDIREALSAVKIDIYNESLKQIDDHTQAYHNGKINLLSYASFLYEEAKQNNLELEAYNNIKQYLKKSNPQKREIEKILQEIEKLNQTIRQEWQIVTHTATLSTKSIFT